MGKALKSRDLENKTEKELLDMLSNLRLSLKNLRFDLKLAKLKNTRLISETKRNIARVLTILRLKYRRKL